MSGFVVSASLEDFHLLENDVDAPDNSPRPECSQLTKREEEFGGFLIRGRRYKHLQASENVQLEYCVEKPQQIGKNRLLQKLLLGELFVSVCFHRVSLNFVMGEVMKQ